MADSQTNTPEKKTLLKLDNLTMQFGGLKAIDALSMEVKEGEIVGLIGPNGAGKTTVFNCMTQFYDTYEGDILFRTNQDELSSLRGVRIDNVINYGIVRTFQNIELVMDLSVIDNLLIGAHKQFKTGFFQHLFKTPNARKEEETYRQKAEEILEFMNIAHLKDAYVAGQPYGVQKKIEIARTLMGDPKLIILDEPAAGLNDNETDELEKLFYELRDEFNVTILLIEHDMGFVMNICDRVCAINFGKFLAMDTPKNIRNNKQVQEAYLGEEV